ncbi:YeeE/YedE family protein [Flammeovirga yaeyamensis]|uniref:YeeE/YedE family protein n=1 Tax=Flammeovirga yaeyamensis TaxID=367791 RepID=A0AAX1NBG6_9BACT|nr:rhodanese-like domain-containing protein [Flammeovirga yaeyamensis]MBB3700091.1 hypothetical protein [Flammeovirga yaeyamensis]NMF37474.1 rhodanese-like domain-containing protein [Flammeovirga yaeyamensis]QWG04532.1 YeeE/YedE family protein [Flammeovirga yaeyamensis]
MIAPLVPEIINTDLNLLVALLVGFGFGFALEQAGFSSTKKLAGLFYGYDFTVLRVFFTAGVTAMLGVMVFAKLGWLDLSLIYINPTFLYSAIIGGGIMGLGFIIGGFCPGTSIVGATVGRIDAMVFVLGGGIGIYLFGEFFPLYESIYSSNNLGGLTAYEVLGVTKETFTVLLTLVALMAFVATYFIENKVNDREDKILKSNKLKLAYGSFGVIFSVIALWVNFTPDKSERLVHQSQSDKVLENTDFRYYSHDKLAYKLLQQEKDSTVNVIDLRDKSLFAKQNIPTSFNIALDSIQDRKYEVMFKDPSKITVIYADNMDEAKSAYYIMNKLNYHNVYVLEGSANSFYITIMTPQELPDNPSMQDQFNKRFRDKARIQLPVLALKMKQKPVIRVKKKVKIQGGCS